eukprot:916464-Rhodomonas_salina.1
MVEVQQQERAGQRCKRQTIVPTPSAPMLLWQSSSVVSHAHAECPSVFPSVSACPQHALTRLRNAPGHDQRNRNQHKRPGNSMSFAQPASARDAVRCEQAALTRLAAPRSPSRLELKSNLPRISHAFNPPASASAPSPPSPHPCRFNSVSAWQASSPDPRCDLLASLGPAKVLLPRRSRSRFAHACIIRLHTLASSVGSAALLCHRSCLPLHSHSVTRAAAPALAPDSPSRRFQSSCSPGIWPRAESARERDDVVVSDEQ